MRQSPSTAGNAADAICITIVTKVEKGTPRNKIEIVRVKIRTIAPAQTSLAVDKKSTRRRRRRSPKF